MNFSEFLANVPSFAEFSNQELAVLEQAMVVRDYPDGHLFVEEGRGAESMYLVIEGKVEVSRRQIHGRGHDVLAQLGSGELFGLISLLDYGPHTATCMAVGPVQAASLTRGAFTLLFKANNRVAYDFQHLIAAQLVEHMRAHLGGLLKRLMDEQQPDPPGG
jgi:CRP-like cAMP-binding protein